MTSIPYEFMVRLDLKGKVLVRKGELITGRVQFNEGLCEYHIEKKAVHFRLLFSSSDLLMVTYSF